MDYLCVFLPLLVCSSGSVYEAGGCVCVEVTGVGSPLLHGI